MTDYIVARTPFHYKKAHELIKEAGLPDGPLNFPTAMAIKDQQVVAVLGTDTSQDMIIAGPLAVKPGPRRVFTVLRLIEFYEDVMRGFGITSFIFSIENDSPWKRQAEEAYGIKPYAEKDGRSFFIRNL